MAESPAPLTDAEVLALKKRYRAALNRLTGPLALAGLLTGLLIIATQATMLRGPRPVFLWGPVAIELILILVFTGRRRWGMAALCGVFLVAHVRCLPQAALVTRRPGP